MGIPGKILDVMDEPSPRYRTQMPLLPEVLWTCSRSWTQRINPLLIPRWEITVSACKKRADLYEHTTNTRGHYGRGDGNEQSMHYLNRKTVIKISSIKRLRSSKQQDRRYRRLSSDEEVVFPLFGFAAKAGLLRNRGRISTLAKCRLHGIWAKNAFFDPRR